MAKSAGLPSLEEETQPRHEPKAKSKPEPKTDRETMQEMGHLSRTVDIRMTGGQPLKFKRIMRHLEDSGATLADGSAVTNKRRAALWLIENFTLPS